MTPTLTRTSSYSSTTSYSSSTPPLQKHEAFAPTTPETTPWWLGEEGYEKWTVRWLEDNDVKNCLVPVGVKSFGQLCGLMAGLRVRGAEQEIGETGEGEPGEC
ncbi:hypothetical protein IFR05_003444 [Cadophora sp. M221]|nr:hypothetical protein IFR05_003444 [Cadophora sp. M221]